MKDKNLRMGQVAANFTGGLNTASARQSDVHDHHIGSGDRRLGYGVPDRPGLRHYPQVLRAVQELLNTPAHNFVVIDQHDPQLCLIHDASLYERPDCTAQ